MVSNMIPCARSNNSLQLHHAEPELFTIKGLKITHQKKIKIVIDILARQILQE